MAIRIERLSPEEIERRNIRAWPIWEKEVSRFDWHYDQIEEYLFLKGRVVVETEKGSVEFGSGERRFCYFPTGSVLCLGY